VLQRDCHRESPERLYDLRVLRVKAAHLIDDGRVLLSAWLV
jgi:hypothetical protein